LDSLHGGGGYDMLAGGTGQDTIFGDLGNDSVQGGYGTDSLAGNAGVDFLYGGAGDDTLAGGRGADVLTGGGGADTFVFNTGDSTHGAPDHIADFHHWEHDVILFSDAHSFNGTAAFDGVAGEIRYVTDTVAGETHVFFDANGDKHADSEIILAGPHTLVAADFGL
jgi:Ca2+-binding RTX toxin-like protein